MKGDRGPAIKDPTSLLERGNAAASCAKALRFTMPMVLDEMDDRIAKAYGGWPDRLYIVDRFGRIAYRGGPGPGGFLPDQMEEALKELLASLDVPRMRV